MLNFGTSKYGSMTAPVYVAHANWRGWGSHVTLMQPEKRDFAETLSLEPLSMKITFTPRRCESNALKYVNRPEHVNKVVVMEVSLSFSTRV